MKKTALFVSALLICGMANAQYFCTKNGTELHYVNYDEAGQSISNVTTTVKNVTNEDGKTLADYYSKKVTTKTKNNTSYSLTQWSYDGNNTVCTEDLMYELYIASDSDPAKYAVLQLKQLCRKTKSLMETTLSHCLIMPKPVNLCQTDHISLFSIC